MAEIPKGGTLVAGGPFPIVREAIRVSTLVALNALDPSVLYIGMVGIVAATPGTLYTWDGVAWNAFSSGSKPILVRVVELTNFGSLLGLPIVDSVQTVEGDYVLAIGQGTASQDGAWIAHAGVWTRPPEFAAGDHVSGAMFEVLSGALYSGAILIVTNEPPTDVVDTDGLSIKFSAVTFTAVESALAAANAFVGLNGQDIQSVKEIKTSNVGAMVAGLLIQTSEAGYSAPAGGVRAGADGGSYGQGKAYLTAVDGTTAVERVCVTAKSPTATDQRVGIGEGASNNPHSRLQVDGSLATAYLSTAVNLLLTVAHSFVDADATAAPVTVTLPTAVGVTGREYALKRVDASINALTLATTGGETIDGAATKTIVTQYGSIVVVSDGANWRVKARYLT